MYKYGTYLLKLTFYFVMCKFTCYNEILTKNYGLFRRGEKERKNGQYFGNNILKPKSSTHSNYTFVLVTWQL